MVTPIRLVDLAATLAIDQGELVSIVGGGGKTTTLFALGEQLTGTTVLTTTTKMGAEQSQDYQTLIDPGDARLADTLAERGRALVWQGADGRRAIGVSAATCDRWFDFADNIVVEADGSRKRPFKAPAGHEPVLPSRTTLILACIGAAAFGQPISKGCHRPELVAGIADCSVDDQLTPERAARVLLSPNGSQKGLSSRARFAVLLCRVNPSHHAVADALELALADRAQLIVVADHSGS